MNNISTRRLRMEHLNWTIFIILALLLSPAKKANSGTIRLSIDAEVSGKPFSQIIGGNISHYGTRIRKWENATFQHIIEAGITDMRTHDIKPLDWDLIFPDWNGDVNAETSYHFAAADSIMEGIIQLGFRPFLRIGVSFGATKNKRPLGTNPPDADKFARIAERIVAHYTQGWAKGFHYPIGYVEIWNEPDLSFYTGSPEQFKLLFAKTLILIKKEHQDIKVGGCGIANFEIHQSFGDDLIAYLANPDGNDKTDDRIPLDFFSWHVYEQKKGSRKFAQFATLVKSSLERHGYYATESICSEWNASLPSDYTTTPDAGIDVLSTLIAAENLGVKATYFYPLIEKWGLFTIKNMGSAAYEKNKVDIQWTSMAQAFALYKLFRENVSYSLSLRGLESQPMGIVAGRSTSGNVSVLLATGLGKLPVFVLDLKLAPKTNYDVIFRSITKDGISVHKQKTIATDAQGKVALTVNSLNEKSLLIELERRS